MKFFFDNNLPPALSRAIDCLSLSEWDGRHSVFHLCEKFDRSTADSKWIEVLSNEPGWVVVTHDNLNKGLEREALRRAGLIVFLLDKSWRNHRFWDKSHQLIRWWPAIVDQSERISGGAAFQVPWNISGKGKFKQIKL